MMFLEILIALFIQLTLYVGYFGAILLVLFAAIIAGITVNLLTHWVVEHFLGMGARTPFKRKEESAGERKKRLEPYGKLDKRALKLDADGLERWCEERPEDVAALHELCERCLGAQDQPRYARHRERFLRIAPFEIPAEHAMQCHLLADLYAGPLRDPAKACDALKIILDRFPRTSEAQMARKRLERIEEGLPYGTPGAPSPDPPVKFQARK